MLSCHHASLLLSYFAVVSIRRVNLIVVSILSELALIVLYPWPRWARIVFLV